MATFDPETMMMNFKGQILDGNTKCTLLENVFVPTFAFIPKQNFTSSKPGNKIQTDEKSKRASNKPKLTVIKGGKE